MLIAIKIKGQGKNVISLKNRGFTFEEISVKEK
jgi:hypothetical protein